MAVLGGFVRLVGLFVILSPGSDDAFNVDLNAPIVKRGIRDSYFGFSTAVHHRDDAGENVLLVGAPRHNVTGFTQTGSLFWCPFTSRIDDDCTPIAIDYGERRDNHANQWMGVSVASQSTKRSGSKAVVCAHRYRDIIKSNSKLTQVIGLGLCVTLSNGLDEESLLEPCAGKQNFDDFLQHGMCQAGASVAVDDDNNIVVGVPGIGVWRGAMAKISFQLDNADLDDESHTKWYWSLSDDVIRRGEQSVAEWATSYYSYLGMSVKFGRLVPGYNRTLVGAAPRSRGHGQVIFFVTSDTRDELVAKQHLNGEQIGSGFGSDVAIGDFNGDGKDDIIVGAPFYFQSGISGAIYVYISGPTGIDERNRHRINSRSMKPEECERLSCIDARFGFALANVGDLDKDGCQDVVVGAPYEGLGAVYIYRGSRHQSASAVFQMSQRIYASDLQRATGLRTFGYSFADTRGVDLDNSEYPDIVVGSYASDTVVVLRTRPVVNVMTSMRSQPERLNPAATTCAADGATYNCFSVRACFKFTAEPKNRFNSTLVLQYRIEAETFGGAQASRVFFASRPTAAANNIAIGNVSLLEQWRKSDVCIDEKVYINKNNKDFLRSIAFQLTYNLIGPSVPQQTIDSRLIDLNLYPILVPLARKPTLQVPFVKNCGDDDRCISKLSLEVSVPNLPRNAYGIYELNVASVRSAAELKLDISVVNVGEDAHAATLTVQLPSSVVYTGSDNEAKRYSCTADSAENKIVCSLGNPLVPNQKISFQLALSPDLDAMSFEDYNSIFVTVNTTSTEEDTSDDTRVINVTVIYETDLAVLGSTDPTTVIITNEIMETLPKTLNAVGPEVLHVYEVRNVGPIRMTEFSVEIAWPYRWKSSDTSYILYLIEDPVTKDDLSECRYDKSLVDPLKLTENTNKGENEPAPANIDSFKSKSKRSAGADVDCDNREVECRRIICEISSLEPDESAVIQLFARLWNRTISEEFQYEEEVIISSSARLIISKVRNFRESNSNNNVISVSTTVLFEGVRRGLKIWHIVLAILIGLMLLAAFILLLWKIGFFKRNKFEQEVHYRAEVKRQTDEDDQLRTTAEHSEK